MEIVEKLVKLSHKKSPLFLINKVKAKKLLKKVVKHGEDAVVFLIQEDEKLGTKLLAKYIERIDVEKVFLSALELGDPDVLRFLNERFNLGKYDHLVVDKIGKLKAHVIEALIDMDVLTKSIVWKINLSLDSLCEESLALLKDRLLEKK